MLKGKMVPPALVLAWSVAMVWFAWVGFISSDDFFYAVGAEGWLRQFPYLGETHWELRHPFVLSMAASFALFGKGEYPMVLVTTAYHLAMIALVYVMVSRLFAVREGMAAGFLLGATPLMMVWATIANEDIPEAFFILLSFWLFFSARSVDHPARRLFLAGLAAGLAWLCKETAVGLLLFFGICFLVGYRYPRRLYWIMAAGFALFWLGEWIFYWHQTGDFLYRIRLDLDQGSSRHVMPVKIPGTGNVEVNTWLNPILSLLINDEFGLLFVLALPAMVWAWRARGMEAEQVAFLRLSVGLAAVWFMTIGYLIPLRDLPRYYTVTTILAVIVVAIWLARGVSRKVAIPLTIAYLSLNLALVYVSNRDPLWGARQLVDMAHKQAGTIHTDPITREDAAFLLAPHGLSDKVAEGLPPPGGIYFYNPNSVREDTRPPGFAEAYGPRPEWELESDIQPPRKLSGIVLEYAGLDRHLPAGVTRKLNYQNQAVAVYRARP
jgi:4-amino-4-deoxy-L-arabinose transferase-like glycosyltransferase